MTAYLDTTTGKPLWSVDFMICWRSANEVESCVMTASGSFL